MSDTELAVVEKSPVAAPDPGPLARLEAVKVDEYTPTVVFQRLTDAENPETLREIAKAWRVPAGPFVEWYTTVHASLYDAALKVKADQLAHDALSDADKAEDRDSAAAAKVKADTKLKVASKWDRKRYGEEQDAVRTAPVVIQIANLRGPALEVQPDPKLPEAA